MLTRARVRVRRVREFWAAVPAVAAAVQGRPGLLFAAGVGEAPLGVQGTFSVWRSAAEVRAFAYEGAEHAAVIGAAGARGWYAEELFARFAVVGSTGTVDGHDPLAGTGWGEYAAAAR